MNMGKKITELDHAASVPAGTSFVAEMGDGTGTKHITQEDLIKAVGDSLPLGNIKELLTDDKSSFVSAINEIQQMFALMGIRYWGEYNQDRTYKKMDAVYYDGSTYIALKDNPAGPPVADVANWQYLAKGFMDGYLIAKSQIVNNLLATVPGNVLDAVQGKALADMINGINSNLFEYVVVNCTTPDATSKDVNYDIPDGWENDNKTFVARVRCLNKGNSVWYDNILRSVYIGRLEFVAIKDSSEYAGYLNSRVMLLLVRVRK